MSFPDRIELRTGADPFLQQLAWIIWIAALCSTIYHLPRMPVWLAIVSTTLLCGSIPLHFKAGRQGRRLILNSDGLAQWGELKGHWLPPAWRAAGYTVIRFHNGSRRESLWISARLNIASNYRVLGLWCRFPPRRKFISANDSHLRK